MSVQSCSVIRLPPSLRALRCRSGARRDCECDDRRSLRSVDRACSRLVDTWDTASNDLILSGYAWHMPWTWTARSGEPRSNEKAWGGGWARTVERTNGDTHTVFVLVFRDSHSKLAVEPRLRLVDVLGPARRRCSAGLGYTVIHRAAARHRERLPFPAILPLASVRYGQATLDRRRSSRRSTAASTTAACSTSSAARSLD